jgi:hypothetical protein
MRIKPVSRCWSILALSLAVGLGCASKPSTSAGTSGGATGGAGSTGGTGGSGSTMGVVDAGIPCSASIPCPGALTCCSQTCADVSRDPHDCGQCGQACSATQFCTGTACSTVSFQHLCADLDMTVLQDSSGDQDAGLEIGAALGAACSITVPVDEMAGAAAAGLVDLSTGAPTAGGGHLLAFAGGPDVQSVVKYLEAGVSPVYFTSSSNGSQMSFVARSGGTLATATAAELTTSHDYFMVELVADPGSGTLSCICYGFTGAGTRAGAWYLANEVLPKASTTAASWMIIEWTGQGGATVPSMGDAFQVVASQ